MIGAIRVAEALLLQLLLLLEYLKILFFGTTRMVVALELL